MNDLDFQKVFEVIIDILPSDWIRVAVFVRCVNGSQDVMFYVKNSEGAYENCFELGKDDIEVIKCLSEVGRLVYRDNIENKNYVLSCTVENTGEFNASFDYSDAINSQSYLSNWEKNNLN